MPVMDVDRASYPSSLPSILKHISTSHFIAFDLELSGIPTQRRRDGDGRQTLQKRYEELKHAAERFHVLQIGLSCVEQDAHNGTYLIRAYNFNVSPLMHEHLDIERDFTFSSGAVEFLIGHGFSMEAPYTRGIPYLTREETARARQNYHARWDKAAIPDIQLGPGDTESLRFMQRVRDEIDAWKENQKPESAFYNVGSQSSSGNNNFQPAALSRFERRLVHQLVRAEYPDLQTSSKADFVQVRQRNEEEEKSLRDALQQRLDRSIFTQSGVRWIAEAMAGNDLSEMDTTNCGRQISGEHNLSNRDAFDKRMGELKGALTKRRKVLVGHNCFIDLVYFYKTFYGDLPDSVDEFQEAVQNIFPLVIDTKYVATEGPGGGAFRNAQLWQVEEAVSSLKKPKIEIPSDHPTYINTDRYHEAGFDSYVTAKVLLRLAAQLQEDKAASDAPDTTIDAQASPAFAKSTDGTPERLSEMRHDHRVGESAPSHLTQDDPPETSAKLKTRERFTAATRTSTGSKFSHANSFEGLLDAPQDPARSDAANPIAETPASSSSAIKPADAGADDEAVAAEFKEMSLSGRALRRQRRDKKATKAPPRLIPDWDAAVWTEYGNKLRVYGTVEEVCDLTKRKEEVGEEGEAEDKKPHGEPQKRLSLWEVLVRWWRWGV